MQHCRPVCQASETESVVVGNENKFCAQVKETLRRVLGFAPSFESPAVRPDHDWKFLALAVGWGPDVQVETVLGRGAVDVRCCQGPIVYHGLNWGAVRFIPTEVASGDRGIADVLVLVVAERVVASGGDNRAVIKRDSGTGRCWDGWSALGGHTGCQ